MTTLIYLVKIVVILYLIFLYVRYMNEQHKLYLSHKEKDDSSRKDG